MLRHYFPASGANLDADYTAFLARTPDGVGEVHGTRVGHAAADAIIAARAADDLSTPHPIVVPPGIGVWEPPATGLMAVSWLGFVTPFVLESSTAIPLPGPDAVGSAEYAVDDDEVKAKGALNGSTRTGDETSTALFWSTPVGPVVQYNMAMQTETAERGLDIGETARAFALLDTSISDADISCWYAKWSYAYWRPVAAIQTADDAIPATEPVSVSSAVDVARNARIWLGLHFRQAMTDGNMLGHAAADAVVSGAFVPLD